MKFRAFLLICCMVVVPALAMFSHHLPSSVRSLPLRLLETLSRRLAAGGTQSPAEPDREALVAVVAPAAAGLALEGTGTTSVERLEALGAVAIECQPLPGGGGRIASCRVPVDAEGQLQRIFQARGPDADAATRALAAEVEAWRQRTAGQPSALRLW